MDVYERFTPHPMAANEVKTIPGPVLSGFLAWTSGTITVVGRDAQGTADVTLVDECPVTAGIYTPIPMKLPSPGFTVTLAGGASGTLCV